MRIFPVKAVTSEVIAHFTCGNCGKLNMAQDVVLNHDEDCHKDVWLSSRCQYCRAANILKAVVDVS